MRPNAGVIQHEACMPQPAAGAAPPPATARAFRCRYRRQVLQLTTLDMDAQQAYCYTCLLYAYTCFVYCHPLGMSLSLMPQVLQLATHACTAGTVLHGYALCSHLLCYRHRAGMLLPLLPHVLQLTPDMRAQHYTCMLWGHTCFFHCRPGLSPLPSAGAAACDTRHARTASVSIHPWPVHCH